MPSVFRGIHWLWVEHRMDDVHEPAGYTVTKLILGVRCYVHEFWLQLT